MQGYGVKETTTTTGTGALSLTGVTGYPRFSNVFNDGDLVMYSIMGGDGGPPIECGIGTVTASTNTLTRTFPTVTWDGSTTYSAVSPTAFSLAAGTKYVICTGIPGTAVPFGMSGNASANSKTIGSMHWPGVANAGLALTALRIYLTPFYLGFEKPITAITSRVSVAAAAGKLLNMGIYRVGHDGAIGALLASSGNKAADASGISVGTITTTWFAPGWYVMAIISDGTPTINAYSSAMLPVEAIFGVDSNNLAIAMFTTDPGSLTLPNPLTGTLAAVVGPASVPVLHLRTQ